MRLMKSNFEVQSLFTAIVLFFASAIAQIVGIVYRVVDW